MSAPGSARPVRPAPGGSTRRSRAAALILLAALLAGITWAERRARDRQAQPPPAAPSEAMRRYGFRLEEVAGALGLDFVHEPPAVDPKLAHIAPQIASTGASVAVADVDRDGWLDLYVTTSREGALNRLYVNRGDGTFDERGGAFGVADLNRPGTGVSMGALFGDLDGDGFEDLLVYKWGRPELYRSERGQRFTRMTDGAGLPAWANVNAACLLDEDQDGRLDIFLAGYWPERLDLARLADTKMMPESFEYAQNGGRKWLLRNLGGGRFEDVTAARGLRSTRWTLAVAAADLDRDGDPDLFLANDYGVSELFLNEGRGRGFRDASRASGVAERPESGMNASMGDVLNQGALAIYETNISEEGILLQGNNLWVPVGTAAGGEPRYENLAAGMGVELGGWSWGAQWGDLDNDGALDLYLATGYVSASREDSYWYAFSEITGGHRAIIGDAANWPAMRGRSLAGYQPPRLWKNDGAGHFTEIARAVGADDTLDGRAVALADLGNRGALDVIVANQGGPLLVYRSHPDPANAWIAFDLEGRASNPSAIGAQVTVFWSGRRQLQEVQAGSGFAAQSMRRLHVGLGRAERIDAVEVRWPSGLIERLDGPSAPTVGRVHRLVEGASGPSGGSREAERGGGRHDG